MNRLSIDLSEMNLIPRCFDEETWLIAPSEVSTDYSQTITGLNEDQNLNEWLEGAVKKVDFRTRSALTRRLEKKKLRREKKERLGLSENALAMIDEGSSEYSKNKYIAERWLSSSPSSSTSGNLMQRTDPLFEETDSEEEYFYDTNTNNSMEKFYTPRDFQLPNVYKNVTLRVAKEKSNLKCNFSQKTLKPNELKQMNLSQLEKKAREQEQELRMELINRRERLFTPNINDTLQVSRPNSASSSTSSSIMNLMATSKSVDFSANQNDNKMQSQINNASEINRSDIKTPSSRLAMPRRLAVPGKTNIPSPAPKTLLNNQKKQNGFKDKMISLDVDEDCF